MKILIIEDDKDLAGSIAFCLEKEGYLVTMCHDGEEGLYYMQEDLQGPGDPRPNAPRPGRDLRAPRSQSRRRYHPGYFFLTASGSFRTKSTGWTAARTTTW